MPFEPELRCVPLPRGPRSTDETNSDSLSSGPHAIRTTQPDSRLLAAASPVLHCMDRAARLDTTPSLIERFERIGHFALCKQIAEVQSEKLVIPAI
eukprot:3462576-Pyramimonas_sp.AAC.1